MHVWGAPIHWRRRADVDVRACACRLQCRRHRLCQELQVLSVDPVERPDAVSASGRPALLRPGGLACAVIDGAAMAAPPSGKHIFSNLRQPELALKHFRISCAAVSETAHPAQTRTRLWAPGHHDICEPRCACGCIPCHLQQRVVAVMQAQCRRTSARRRRQTLARVCLRAALRARLHGRSLHVSHAQAASHSQADAKA